jgi:hypothetical protein
MVHYALMVSLSEGAKLYSSLSLHLSTSINLFLIYYIVYEIDTESSISISIFFISYAVNVNRIVVKLQFLAQNIPLRFEFRSGVGLYNQILIIRLC